MASVWNVAPIGGPAIEYKSDKEDEWYCNGIRVTAPVVPKESDEPQQNEVAELMSFSEIFDAMRAEGNLSDEEDQVLRDVFSDFIGMETNPTEDGKPEDPDPIAVPDPRVDKFALDYLTERLKISARADELADQIFNLLTPEEQGCAEMGVLSDVLFLVIDPETEIVEDDFDLEQTENDDELRMKTEYLLRRRDLTEKSNEGCETRTDTEETT